MISNDIITAYNASRAPGTDRSVLCHAPFISLNFDQSGHVTACCYNRRYVLGTYPEQSVREIWNGAPAQALREAFRTGAEAEGCDGCFDRLKNQNFSGTLMRNFDPYTAAGAPRTAGDSGLPLLLEFEISNACNLECVMCGGHWSSAIRARREKLPPIRMQYDRAFVDQIEEFIPTISSAKFLGGEPFLINLYHDIWDSIRRLNPEAQIHITTSGATLPERSRRMLEKLRANIAVSLDGITAPTYESIRKNAHFDEVMENIAYFQDYTRRRGTGLAITVCPMTHNWRELRQIVDFCEERQGKLCFNTVTFPIESSLAGLAEPQLAEVIDHLESVGRGPGRSWTAASREQWQGLINQLHGWMEEKRAFSRRCSEATAAARSFAHAHLAGDAASRDAIAPLIEPLVLAVEVEREKTQARLKPGALAAASLPQIPLALWPEGRPPDTRDLLLAAQVVRRFIAAPDAGRLGPDGAGVLNEIRQLRLAMDGMLESAEARARFDRFGNWMRERLQHAEARRAFDMVGDTRDQRDVRHALALGDSGAVRRRLAEGWTHLGEEVLGEAARTRVRRHFDRVVAFYAMAWLLEVADAAAAVGVGPVSPIADQHDLQAAFHGAHLFHLCFGSPASQESFGRRLGVITGMLTPERSNAMIRALNSGLKKKGDATDLYAFLSSASDEEFARAITAMSA